MADTTAVDPSQTIDGAEVGAPDEGESIRDSIMASMNAEADDGETDARKGGKAAAEDEPEGEAAEPEAAEEVETVGEDESDSDDDEDVSGDEDGGESDEPEPVAAPHSWPAEDKKVFEDLPREAQEIVARREKERDEGAFRALEESKPLRSVAERWDGYFKQLNTTPEAAFDWLMSAEYHLRTGTAEQKQAALEQVAQSYGINLPSGRAPADQLDDESDYEDPQVAALKQEIAELKGQFTSRQQAEQASQVAQYEQTISEFRDAKTEAGAPAHPYFADVESDMVALAQADRAAGKTPELADLYERACWQNPSVREKLLSEQKADEQRKATEERRKRAAAARRASKSVSSSSGSAAPREADKEESVRDSIRAAMRESEAA